jgi:hypothetical protein
VVLAQEFIWFLFKKHRNASKHWNRWWGWCLVERLKPNGNSAGVWWSLEAMSKTIHQCWKWMVWKWSVISSWFTIRVEYCTRYSIQVKFRLLTDRITAVVWNILSCWQRHLRQTVSLDSVETGIIFKFSYPVLWFCGNLKHDLHYLPALYIPGRNYKGWWAHPHANIV